jgi:hypothetical protein
MSPEYVTGTPAQTPVLKPLRYPLYDTENLTVSVPYTEIDLFVDNKKNGAGAAKTESDCNMTTSGQLGTPLEFDLIGFIGHLKIGTALADYVTFYNGGVFKWITGQTTTQLVVKVQQIPAGVAPHGFYTQASPANATLIAHGWGVTSNFYNFTTPDRKARRITSNEAFKNVITFPAGITPSATMYWTTYMLGILYASL